MTAFGKKLGKKGSPASSCLGLIMEGRFQMKKLLAVVLVLALLAPSIAMAVELTPMSDEQILNCMNPY